MARSPRDRTAAIAVTGTLCLILASGCPIGPPFVKPKVELNWAWSEQNDPRVATKVAIDRTWWRGFNDPTLDKLVDLAYHQNLPLQVAGLRILESRARLGIAFHQQFPQGGPSASAAAVGISDHAPNSALVDHDYGDYQFGFDAFWELDFWRKYRRGVKAERAVYLATVADYDNALVALTAEVARVYAMIRTFEVFIAQARDNVAVQEESLHIAESRFRNGATSELDVTQATALLESTRSTIPQLSMGLQQARNALCTLLGRTTACAASLLAENGQIPVPPPQVAISVPAEMLRRRPDIRGAELRAVAQCDRIGIAKADLFPRFVLFGSVGLQSSSGGGAASGDSSFGDLFTPGALFYSFGARLIWPILNYGRILNNVRVEDARFQQSLVEYQNTVIKAAQEVEDGIVGYLRTQEAAAYADTAATAAQSSVKLALVQYREGAVDYQRVLDTQRVLLQSQNASARARSETTTNLIALYKALGGGWEIRADQPVVSDEARIEMKKRTNWGKYLTEPHPPKAKGKPNR